MANGRFDSNYRTDQSDKLFAKLFVTLRNQYNIPPLYFIIHPLYFILYTLYYLNNMIAQTEFALRAYPRGIHLVTGDIMRQLPQLPECGLLNLLIKHTSAALALNENADPDVRLDLRAIFDRLVPENAPFYLHTDEGPDDMPSHAKSVLVGPSLTIPVKSGHLNLGTWQGIYLCEFRNYGGPRRIVATVIGE